MRNTSYMIVGAALGAVSTLALVQGVPIGSAALAAGADTYRQLNLFGDVFERIRADYVEEPADESLIENAINGMLASLDPHSSYLNPKNFRDMQVQTRGEFGGLGIEVTMEEGLVKVVTPIDGTPAQAAGVLPGDLIVELDGEQVQGLTLNEAVERMRGAVKEPITITVLREGADEPFDIEIVRDIITIQAVRSRVEDEVGYLRVTSFSERTFEDLRDAMSELTEEIGEDDLKGFVVDLRNNPGGLLDQAIAVSDAFLEQGEIVSTRGRDPEDTQRYNARAGDLSDGKPVIVMINGGSASASEIVAGALQDHQRATVIGTRSFGKGSVQTIIPLGSDGAVRLTTARYYTPSGTSIQAKGIEPDIVVQQELPEELIGKLEARGEASLRGHLANDDGEEAGSLAYVPSDPEDDKQLRYALDLLSGIQVNSAFPTTPETIPN
ncbi:MAG: S41 family peptidase [Pseudomonadota bacterium]